MPAYLHLRMSYYAVGIREEVPNGAQRRGLSSLAMSTSDAVAAIRKPLGCNHT